MIGARVHGSPNDKRQVHLHGFMACFLCRKELQAQLPRRVLNEEHKSQNQPRSVRGIASGLVRCSSRSPPTKPSKPDSREDERTSCEDLRAFLELVQRVQACRSRLALQGFKVHRASDFLQLVELQSPWGLALLDLRSLSRSSVLTLPG